MHKWILLNRLLLLLSAGSLIGLGPLAAQLSQTLLQHAQADVQRIRVLVEQGTLPKWSLLQAEERLADAQDEETLAETLYSPVLLQDTTPEQAQAMVDAASRRVDRAALHLTEKEKLLQMGIISQSELDGLRGELKSRQLVLELSRNRMKLLDDLHDMAAQEQRLQIATMQNSLIRYDGAASFQLTDLPTIEKQFKARFHRDLPISAIGQTLLHQSMGLDHRNKVDVALNPELPEGQWLRRYLEALHISYLAFRSAVAGAATGAHIHIGSGSARLAITKR